jgi:hypothetical protein
MKHPLLPLFLAAVGTVYGADWEFDHVVHAIESHYHVKRTQIPLMGVANFMVKVVRPAGTTGFKLATFEDLQADDRDPLDLDRFMDEVSSGGLHRLVVTHSRPQGESTYILAGEVGKSTKMLIASFERNEATVVEVQVNVEELLRIIGAPDEAHNLLGQKRGDRGDRY